MPKPRDDPPNNRSGAAKPAHTAYRLPRAVLTEIARHYALHQRVHADGDTQYVLDGCKASMTSPGAAGAKPAEVDVVMLSERRMALHTSRVLRTGQEVTITINMPGRVPLSWRCQVTDAGPIKDKLFLVSVDVLNAVSPPRQAPSRPDQPPA